MEYSVLANKCAMLIGEKPPPDQWGREELLSRVKACLQACRDLNGMAKQLRPYEVSSLLALEEQLKEKQKELETLLATKDEHD